MERAGLDGLGDISVKDVYMHADILATERPGPLELFRRWEAQQWSLSDLDFSTDRDEWARMDPQIRAELHSTFSAFFVGEQAVTDTLSPLIVGAPDEESRLFLSTQMLDEARHSFFFSRFWEEAIGVGGAISAQLNDARPWTATMDYRQVFDHDLPGVTEAAANGRTNPALWIEAVTLYHILVEGTLALPAQRMVLESLRDLKVLNAFRKGFTAVTRDESRHVSFGVWALHRAASTGMIDGITTSLNRSLEPILRIWLSPEEHFIPVEVADGGQSQPEWPWEPVVESLMKRLTAARLPHAYLLTVKQNCRDILRRAAMDYRDRWGEEHPSARSPFLTATA